jgi:beta-glucosidase-like glycosyl hydrolase/CubicO group peptidase (beta-lactamase class C family)
MRGALTILFFSVFLTGWSPPKKYVAKEKTDVSVSWVDSVYESLTLDQQIAQLFMIEVRPRLGTQHLTQVSQMVERYQVGGLIFFKGNPVQQVQLTNRYQKLAQTPLLVAIDGEWGLAMRLKNIPEFSYQLGLGGIRNNTLIYQMGKEVGRQCKRMGIHVNFAPVIDVNNNPNNPVINYRSFGEDKENVAKKGWAYALGMQDAGIIACAKHFPGHGDTDVDSHKDLPVINHSIERLETVEMYPFQFLMDRGIKSVMTAHLYIPAIDSTPKTAISISEKAINGVMRQKMHYDGLAFTDALNMQGVAKYHQPGELELKALKAGNDILLSPGNISKATQLIKVALANGEISEEYLENKVKKVLKAKYDVGLHQYKPIEVTNLMQDLVTPKTTQLIARLTERQMCLVRDEHQIVPIQVNEQKRLTLVTIGGGVSSFSKALNKHRNVNHFILGKNANPIQCREVMNQISSGDTVIVALHKTSKYPSSYGLNANTVSFIQMLNQSNPMLLVNFGNPYNLGKIGSLKSVLMAYQDFEENQQAAANALVGASRLDARLAISVGDYTSGSGVYIHPRNKLFFAQPESVGMDPDILKNIDDIARKAIRLRATPGCQILVARNGKIVYNKTFGHYTYEKKIPVTSQSKYDIASITKIAATTLSVMRLVEEGAIQVDDKLSQYLPFLVGSNKEDMTIRQVLEHKAGLKDWIPFYYETVKDDGLYDTIYHYICDSNYCVPVGNGLFMDERYKDTIIQRIIQSPMRSPGRYKYSDLGMILMKELIERVTETPFEDYTRMVFYEPLGLQNTLFKPMERFAKEEIVPTEFSIDMRKGLIWGHVHDPACAMLGGVSGHAGLFSTAEDLAVIMQMLLNGGYYENMRFFEQETIERFTARQSSDSRRGLGFDKPEPRKDKGTPTSRLAPGSTFGHSGFTGTQVWADPDNDLIYVFLSNRVHPTAENKRLIRENIRTSIMDEIYKSMGYSKDQP